MKAISRMKELGRDTYVIAAVYLTFLLVLAFSIQLLVGLIAFLLETTDNVLEPFTLSLALILVAWIASVMGLLTSFSDVRQSAIVVAKRLGAVQASARSGNQEELGLIRIVADVAIAYQCTSPSVHILAEESGINVLTVGSLSNDKAILFTRGAVRKLSEDELSALVAHEYAHIANGDVRRNMKLMVAFSGLLALDQYGHLLVHNKRTSVFRSLLGLAGYLLIGFGLVGRLFAAFLRIIYTRSAEIKADMSAVNVLGFSRSMCSALSKIKQSPERDSALHAPFANEVRHLCFHAGHTDSWYNRFNSSHPVIEKRLYKIDPNTAAAYANGTLAALSSASVDSTEPERSLGSSENRLSQKTAYTHSPEVTQAANEAAKMLAIPAGESLSSEVSDKLALTVQDPVSSLAALFSLFVPSDQVTRQGYLSAVAFAYNQNFADAVAHIKSVLEREIYENRLSVAKHAASQLKTKLDPDASRRVLLNLERLLKVQGLHNLMNYSAVQYLRHELSADFTLLTKTANANDADAEGLKLKPSDKMGEEFSRLFSLVLDATDLDRSSAEQEYERVMALYTDADYPRCDEDELADVVETEACYQLLLMQPRAIRETFVQQCNDIFNLDNVDVQAKRSQLDLLTASLGCSEQEHNHWRMAV